MSSPERVGGGPKLPMRARHLGLDSAEVEGPASGMSEARCPAGWCACNALSTIPLDLPGATLKSARRCLRRRRRRRDGTPHRCGPSLVAVGAWRPTCGRVLRRQLRLRWPHVASRSAAHWGALVRIWLVLGVARTGARSCATRSTATRTAARLAWSTSRPYRARCSSRMRTSTRTDRLDS